MGNLFFRLYVILVVVMSLYIVGINNIETILSKTLHHFIDDLSYGTLQLIDKKLQQHPTEQWSDWIDRLNQGQGYQLSLKTATEYELPTSVIQQLDEQGFVLHGHDHALAVYQRIGVSELILRFPVDQSEYEHNQRLGESTFDLLEWELRDHPAAAWPSIIATLNGEFKYPITLLAFSELKLTNELHQELLQGKVVWQRNDAVEYLYRRIDSSEYVLRLGSFDIPLTLNYLESILLICLASIIAMAVLLWVYPLWRDLLLLSRSADAFGKGQFTIRAKLRKRSAIQRLAQTFNAMADRIQRLIASHKELTNAVSHELRTPIARLRFGMEMLQSAPNATTRQRFMQSMQADIDELDRLVAELLTYARFDRDRPSLNFQRQAIEPWLISVLEQAKMSITAMVFDYDIHMPGEKYAQFEPKLMARAVNNLLQNASRYAQRHIKLSCVKKGNMLCIHVDDDGPGIHVSDRERIFQAFTRLDTSRDRDTGGYGLGLVIVSRIAQWHQGQVSVTDSPLGGARFSIVWPEYT